MINAIELFVSEFKPKSGINICNELPEKRHENMCLGPIYNYFIINIDFKKFCLYEKDMNRSVIYSTN